MVRCPTTPEEALVETGLKFPSQLADTVGMARVTYVQKARKAPGICRCGKKIEAGDSYFWWQNYRSPKQFRCSEHRPRPSEYATTSDKLSRLYAAQENVEDALVAMLGDPDDASDIAQALRDAAETAREVGDEYRESADNIEDGFGTRTSQCDELEEKGDNCDSWADELESAADDLDTLSADDYMKSCDECDGQGEVAKEDEPDETMECGECEGTGEVRDYDTFREEVESKANDAIGALEL